MQGLRSLTLRSIHESSRTAFVSCDANGDNRAIEVSVEQIMRFISGFLVSAALLCATLPYAAFAQAPAPPPAGGDGASAGKDTARGSTKDEAREARRERREHRHSVSHRQRRKH